MNIASITIYRKDLPLADAFEHSSSGPITSLEEIFVKVEDEDGVAGFGEARGNCQYVTGDTPNRLVGVLTDALAPALLGCDPLAVGRVHEIMDGAVTGNTGAKSAVDMAIHDLLGKVLGVPAYVLLGGKNHDELMTDVSIPFCPPEEAYDRTRRHIDDGFRLIKIRVGLRPFQQDIERVEAIRRAVNDHPGGREVSLAADANQAWSVKEAITNIRQLTPHGLLWVEQPVASGNIYGLRDVTQRVDVAIMADESCGTPEDVLRLVSMRAADMLHLKICKAGGLNRIRTMMSIAEAAGVPYMIGQMDEGMLATAAAVHCAAASTGEHFELWGYHRVAQQPISGLRAEHGRMFVPDDPGLGVRVHEECLERVEEFHL